MELVDSGSAGDESVDEQIDEEVGALAVIVDVVAPLPPDAQSRIVAYLSDRYAGPRTWTLAMTNELRKAGATADLLDALSSLRAAVAVMADSAVGAAESHVAAAQAHLASVTSMRAAIHSYDRALTVLTSTNP